MTTSPTPPTRGRPLAYHASTAPTCRTCGSVSATETSRIAFGSLRGAAAIVVACAALLGAHGVLGGIAVLLTSNLDDVARATVWIAVCFWAFVGVVAAFTARQLFAGARVYTLTCGACGTPRP